MVGRGSKRRPAALHEAALPEAAELFRADPELSELIEEVSDTEPDQAESS
jgi:hypothetical protein